MGITRTDFIEPEVLRHPDNSMELKTDEKPSEWVKRITGKKPNKQR